MARPGFSGFPAVLTTDYLCCRVKMEKEKQQNKNNADDPQQPAAPSADAGGEQPGSGDGSGDGGGISLLLNNLPALLMDYYGHKHAAVRSVVPLHWQEAREEIDELVNEVRHAFVVCAPAICCRWAWQRPCAAFVWLDA